MWWYNYIRYCLKVSKHALQFVSEQRSVSGLINHKIFDIFRYWMQAFGKFYYNASNFCGHRIIDFSIFWKVDSQYCINHKFPELSENNLNVKNKLSTKKKSIFCISFNCRHMKFKLLLQSWINVFFGCLCLILYKGNYFSFLFLGIKCAWLHRIKD